ncbi:hypothetical protein CEXT_264201 [Caerostris extrusa]|uniref:Uncharacterized protein n=1 Tax=Caerostris extrusa TaxID=172846 RepID=A0AAV4TH33_CAEEX|nr:hypothetical protein CEXT_264201 [Caerostris extrusa]
MADRKLKTKTSRKLNEFVPPLESLSCHRSLCDHFIQDGQWLMRNSVLVENHPPLFLSDSYGVHDRWPSNNEKRDFGERIWLSVSRRLDSYGVHDRWPSNNEKSTLENAFGFLYPGDCVVEFNLYLLPFAIDGQWLRRNSVLVENHPICFSGTVTVCMIDGPLTMRRGLWRTHLAFCIQETVWMDNGCCGILRLLKIPHLFLSDSYGVHDRWPSNNEKRTLEITLGFQETVW